MNERRTASEDSIRAVLSTLGVPTSSTAQIRDALRARQEQNSRTLPPVSVTWGARSSPIEVPFGSEPKRVRAWVRTEEGETLPCRTKKKTSTDEGGSRESVEVRLPSTLPPGYHELNIEGGNDVSSGALFAAPASCFSRPGQRTWGVFAPVYALATDRSWGAGDLRDLATTLDRIRGMGGQFAGTLPLLAAFLDDPIDPSPYNPMSRLHWNEFFLDVTSAPGFSECAEAKALIESDEFQAALQEFRASPTVDYPNLMKKKREVLEILSAWFHESGDRAGYEAFLRRNPDVESYATFRAAHEKRGDVWHKWPSRMKGGSIPPSAWNEATRRYHMYVQWAMHQALDTFRAADSEASAGLYLDYPLGVHPDGYDTWKYQDLFATGTSVGAPPDAFFTRGQNWGFPPMQPERLLERRLDYFIASVRNQLRYAGMLRIDHVMALNRLFWIPEGAEAADGVYVKYPAEAMYAVLAIESHRSRSVIIGEDLGTVPEEVRTIMEQKGVRRMYVLQYELSADSRPQPPAKRTIASINTHDMPTFTSWWNGMDIEQRREAGLLDEKGEREERRNRESIRSQLTDYLTREKLLAGPSGKQSDDQILEAALAFLAGSEAEMVLVNLEDLWQEETPQNVPGTSSADNWKQKLRHSIDETFALPEVTGYLRMIDDRRRQPRK